MVLTFVFFIAKRKELFYSVLSIEMAVCVIINLLTPFDSKRMEYVDDIEVYNSVLDNVDVDENSLNRVYIVDDEIHWNRARYSNVLTNEGSFHSFFNKYIYDHYYLYLVNYDKISEQDYEPIMIQNPSSYFACNNDWICTPESFLYEKINDI